MTDLIKPTQSKNGLLSDKEIDILSQAGIIPSSTPPEQVYIFQKFCEEKGLSPFSKEVYLTAYFNKREQRYIFANIIGIDGYRKRAAQTREHAGTDDVKFDVQPNGEYLTAAQLQKANRTPRTATVTVYRMIQGNRVPFSHTAVFTEFYTGKQKWYSMPFQMIAKVAEAFALRKGFADVLSGFSIEEEGGAFEEVQPINEETKPLLNVDNPRYQKVVDALVNQKTDWDEIQTIFTVSDEVKEMINNSVEEKQKDHVQAV